MKQLFLFFVLLLFFSSFIFAFDAGTPSVVSKRTLFCTYQYYKNKDGVGNIQPLTPIYEPTNQEVDKKEFARTELTKEIDGQEFTIISMYMNNKLGINIQLDKTAGGMSVAHLNKPKDGQELELTRSFAGMSEGIIHGLKITCSLANHL